MNKTYFLILWILVLYIYQGLPCGSEVKVSASNVGDPGSIPGLGWSPGEREIYIFIYIYIERERESPGDSDGKESPWSKFKRIWEIFLISYF